jgi:hypothetical protein
MRYALAILALVAAVTAAAPYAMAGENGGRGCYHNGVVSSCVQPAPLYLGTGASSGILAEPGASSQKAYPF